jgi:hypothetical protein
MLNQGPAPFGFTSCDFSSVAKCKLGLALSWVTSQVSGLWTDWLPVGYLPGSPGIGSGDHILMIQFRLKDTEQWKQVPPLGYKMSGMAALAGG